MFIPLLLILAAADPDTNTYGVAKVAQSDMQLDGRLEEPAWGKAKVEDRFTFPWKKSAAPSTKFRAFYDDSFLYFAFQVEDADIVALDRLRDEEDQVFEDRVELYFAADEELKKYFCVEIDSLGRIFDYQGAFYRKLDPAWNWRGPQAAAARDSRGYTVEGRIPLAAFESLGFPALRAGSKIRVGLYRAEFSHDRSGRPVEQRETIHNRGRKLDGPPPIEDWISWVDPQTKEPDFHVPTALGWFVLKGESSGQ